MNDRQKIVAIGFLTNSDIDKLGSGFRRLYPVGTTTFFDDLLRAIDDADKQRGRPVYERHDPDR